MINVICCECKKKYGEKQDGKKRVVESHGYCGTCHKEIMKKIETMKADKKAGGFFLI